MMRCPICKGRIQEDLVCTRCGADLDQLDALTQEVRRRHIKIMQSVVAGNLVLAWAQTQSALQLSRDNFTLRLGDFVNRLCASDENEDQDQ